MIGWSCLAGSRIRRRWSCWRVSGAEEIRWRSPLSTLSSNDFSFPELILAPEIRQSSHQQAQIVHRSISGLELCNRPSWRTIDPVFVWHEQSIATDHALEDILLAVPPVQVTLDFIVLNILRRKVMCWHRRICLGLPLIVVTNREACQLPDHTFVNFPIFVW